jgi:hypothetical protein
VSGAYDVSYGGATYAPQFGIFFNDLTHTGSPVGPVLVRDSTSTSVVDFGFISVASTLTSPDLNSYFSGPTITATTSQFFPFFMQVYVSIGPSNPLVYFASRVTTSGGGGGPAFRSGSIMSIEKVS